MKERVYNNTWVVPGAIDLGTYLVRLFRSQGSEASKSEEFLNLEKVYGREKLRQIYKKGLEKEKNPQAKTAIQQKVENAPEPVQELVHMTQEILGADLLSLESKQLDEPRQETLPYKA